MLLEVLLLIFFFVEIFTFENLVGKCLFRCVFLSDISLKRFFTHELFIVRLFAAGFHCQTLVVRLLTVFLSISETIVADFILWGSLRLNYFRVRLLLSIFLLSDVLLHFLLDFFCQKFSVECFFCNFILPSDFLLTDSSSKIFYARFFSD